MCVCVANAPVSLCVTDIYLNVSLIVVDTFTRSLLIKYTKINLISNQFMRI